MISMDISAGGVNPSVHIFKSPSSSDKFLKKYGISGEFYPCGDILTFHLAPLSGQIFLLSNAWYSKS